MPILVRRALLEDGPTIVEFNCRLAEESEGKRLDRSRIVPGVDAVLSNPRKGRYFVALCDDESTVPATDARDAKSNGARIVGQLMHTFEWSDWRNGEIWWLQSVYVVPEFRRQGVFRALFDHLRHEAASDPGVVGLRLYVEEQNRRAQATYESLGMTSGGYFVMEQMLRRGDFSPGHSP
jgi:ribosomal protein S18 acetylase RimI-like enzyme